VLAGPRLTVARPLLAGSAFGRLVSIGHTYRVPFRGERNQPGRRKWSPATESRFSILDSS
jgi:hypothetical protein